MVIVVCSLILGRKECDMSKNVLPKVQDQFNTLAESMLKRERIVIEKAKYCGCCSQQTGIDKIYGVVNVIEAEDGSGHNFNITLDTGATVFVKLTEQVVFYDLL